MWPALFRSGADQAISLASFILLLACHSIVGGPRALTHISHVFLSSFTTLVSVAALTAGRIAGGGGFQLDPIAFRGLFRRLLMLYGLPLYLLTLLAAFFDGPPENMADSVHMINGTDWRYWIAFGLLLVSRRAVHRDSDFCVDAWLLMVIPGLVYWLLHAKWTMVCWDFVLGDLLARLSVVLSHSHYHHWRVKFLIGFAVLSVLRLNTYHCDPRIASRQPTVSSESHLVHRGKDSECISVLKAGSYWLSHKECWSNNNCFSGQSRLGLKHGDGDVIGTFLPNREYAGFKGQWLNGFTHGQHQLKPFEDYVSFIGGVCVNGTCLRNRPSGAYRRRASVLLLEHWTVDDVSAWLADLNMPASYRSSFAAERISGTELLAPQLPDEEYLLLLNVSTGDSVRLAGAIYKLQQLHRVHQQELVVLAESLSNPACSLSGSCSFFGNVYPKIRRNLLASLNLPSKSVLFDAVWHVLEVFNQMDWHHSVPHTMVHSRKQTSEQEKLVRQWSKQFHLSWPRGVLTEHTVLAALGIDESVFITYFQHFTGALWSSANLRWYFVLLMDLDNNYAVDFSEFALFVRAYSHFYPLQLRTTHRGEMEHLWPSEARMNSYSRESLLFHTIRLSLEQSVLGSGKCQKFAAAFVSSSPKTASKTIQNMKPVEELYYGFDPA